MTDCLAKKLFLFCCSIMSFFGRFPAVNQNHFSMVIVRFIYSSLCAALTGRPEKVADIQQISIAGPAGNIKLKIYRQSPEQVNPAFLFIHGGSFCIGDLSSHDILLRALANACRWTIISVDYRRAPESPFPQAADDCYAALEFLAAHAGRLKIDCSTIAVGGDSAGAAIAAVIARWTRDRHGPSLAAQILLYPLTDARMQTPSWTEMPRAPGLDREMVEAAWSCYAPVPADRYSADVSPMAADNLRDLPPALVITAEKDPLRDEGEAYAGCLGRHGVPVEYTCYAGQTHAFIQFPFTPAGRQAISQIAAYLHKINSEILPAALV